MKKLLTYGLLGFAVLSVGTAFSNAKNVKAETTYKEVGVTELMENSLDTTLSEVEKSYIERVSDYSIKYPLVGENHGIRTATYHDTLYVFVDDVTYDSITWKAEGVTYKDTTYPFSEFLGNRCAIIEDYDESVTTFSVPYSATIQLDKSKMDGLVSKAYSDGEYYSNLQKSYDDYQAELAIYNDYLEDYDEYQSQLETYYADLDSYNAYLVAKAKYAQYEKDLEVYNEYLKAKAAYDNECQYAVDDDQIDLVNQANHCLDVMGIAYEEMKMIDFTPSSSDSGYRVMAESICGSTVTSVLEQKGALKSLTDAPEKAFDDADAATNVLRPLFNEYSWLTTDRERYKFYYNTYETLFTNAYKLFRSLERMFRSNAVYNLIESKGKIPQYQLLIAQLAYFTRALAPIEYETKRKIYNYEGYDTDRKGSTKPTNAAIINNTWTFNGHTIPELIGDSYTVDDQTASGKPTTSDANFPILLSSLTPPDVVEKPEVVSNPTEVFAPTMPTEPTKVNKPTADSALLVKMPLEDYQVTLMNAYKNGELVERPKLSKYLYSTTDSVTCDINDDRWNIAVYHDNDGVAYHTDLFKIGSSVEIIPEKEGDTQWTGYVFDGWKDKDGNVIDISTLDHSEDLYPYFHGDNLVRYEITWIIGNKTYKTKVEYDTLPVCTFNLVKEDTYDHFYIFDRWDKEIVPVTGPATYTALFEEHNFYDIKFKSHDGTVTRHLKEGEMPIAPDVNDYDGTNYYYLFRCWDKDIVAANENATYTALYWSFEYVKLNYKDANGNDTTVKVKQDEIPDVPDNSTYYDLNYRYDFYEWEMDGLNYSARYEKTRRLNDKTFVALSDNLMSFDARKNTTNFIDAKLFKDFYWDELNSVSNIKLLFNNVEIVLSSSSFKNLLNKDLASIGIEFLEESTGSYALTIFATDSSGNNLDLDVVLSLDIECSLETAKLSNVDSEKVVDLSSSFSSTIKLNSKYKLAALHNIAIEQDNGVVVMIQNQASTGDIINFTYTLLDGYEIDELLLYKTNGALIKILDENSFTMPNYDVYLKATTKLINYTVNFYVDDKLISTGTYHYGDKIEFPSEVTKSSDEEYNYVFSGWDSDVTYVNGNIDFHANFIKTEVPKADNSALIKTLLIVGIVLISSCILGVLLYIIIKSFRRKAKR